MVQQIIFVLVSIVAIGYAFWQFMKLRRNIFLGKPEVISGNTGQRWRNVLLVSLGQQKMFKNWMPAVFHFFIYAAFVITQVELIEIFIDGVTGIHRFFWPALGGFYTFVISFIEILSVLALLATIVFLARRNLLKIPRFRKPEMKGWPFQDANIILYLEIALIVFIFMMNSADMALHNNEYGFAVSQFISPLLAGVSESTLHLLERIGWWGHVGVVFAFLNYLPISKHLHILFAFPNTYYAPLESRGKMENMPEIMNEVKSMMGLSPEGEVSDDMGEELPEFGVNDIFGLSWKNILDAYSCTECGRCTAQCPANLTGKKLSPRKIVMDIRDRAEEVGRNIDSGDKKYAIDPEKPLGRDNYQDGKTLFDYISREELHACTTCNACVEACPVLINPMEPILQMRRYEILTESAGPQDWLPMFNAMENGGAVWQVPDERKKWAVEAVKSEE
jgi:heterodisulfide reductase subunit C